MSSYATAQKILCAGYFWPSIFKDCILTIRSCHPCQIYQCKMHVSHSLLHLVITVSPFAKWGIYFMTCNPHSARGHGYIIVVIDYFMKWVEAMRTLTNDGKTTTQFLFNHVIARFRVPQAIITNHGSHFHSYMMAKLTSQLGLCHDSSTPYYPHSNGQVEVVNKVLVTMLQHTIGMHNKSSYFKVAFTCSFTRKEF